MTLSKNFDIRNIFSINLKYYRIQNNLSQFKLAEMVNVTDKYISDLERNLYDPSLGLIDSLAKSLNVEAYLLLKYDETHKSTLKRIKKP